MTIRRRRFLAGAAALPLAGWLVPGTASATESAPAHAECAQGPAELVWERLDHCSSWSETVAALREYAASGGPDGDVYAAVADAIDRELRTGDPDTAHAVLGFYGGAVLMLGSLEQMRRYGTDADHRAQLDMVRRLAEGV